MIKYKLCEISYCFITLYKGVETCRKIIKQAKDTPRGFGLNLFLSIRL